MKRKKTEMNAEQVQPDAVYEKTSATSDDGGIMCFWISNNEFADHTKTPFDRLNLTAKLNPI